MFDLRAVHKTGLPITVQNVLRRTFRTRGRQTSILGAVAQPKNFLLDCKHFNFVFLGQNV